MSWRRTTCLFIGLIVTATFPGVAASDSPRPLTAAERAGVELAVAYSSSGAEAWVDRLAGGSALAGMSPAEAKAEIAVRVGPASGATWRLLTPAAVYGPGAVFFRIEYPSGVDEILALDLVDAAGNWEIRRLRSLVDPPLERIAAVSPASSDRTESAHFVRFPGASWVAVALCAFLIFSLAPRRRSWLQVSGHTLACCCLVGLLVACAGDVAEPPAPEARAQPGPAGDVDENVEPLRLAALAPMRTALAAGKEADLVALAEEPGGSQPHAQAGRLWLAQWQVDRLQIARATETLAGASGQTTPLALLLEARLGLLRGDVSRTTNAYLDLFAKGVDVDALRIESAVALSRLGQSGQTELAFTELGELGSREAMVHYGLARYSAFADRMSDAETRLRTAWTLEPVLREDLLRDVALAHIAVRPGFLANLELSQPEDPVLKAPKNRTPLSIPASMTAAVVGRLLLVKAPDWTLEVPAGAVLAPDNARIESAAVETRRREEDLLADVDGLIERVREVGGLALLAPEIEDTAIALSRRNRHAELLKLTEGLAGVVDRAVPGLVRLRAAALKREGHTVRAKRLLVAQAKSDQASGRRDASVFYDLAELFAAEEDYDSAIKSIRRGNSLSFTGPRQYRERQLTLEKTLAESSETLETRHFDIRYPRVTGAEYAGDLGQVLEAEFVRLRRWIPVRQDVRIQVDLFPLQDFLTTYSSTVAVLGLFDGRVKVPFADLGSLRPEVVSILTHELAHAMIADKTGDYAPRWFQEGLAQHVEMGTGPVNPLPDLDARGSALSIPVIQSVLTGFGEAQLVELAYNQSAWAVHAIQARHGVAGIHRMLNAFAGGANTEQAVERAFGQTVAEFDRAVWRWCIDDAPLSWRNEVRRYDRDLQSLIQRG